MRTRYFPRYVRGAIDIYYGWMEHALCVSLDMRANFILRQFCEFGLQTSHTCSIIFPPMGYYFPGTERIRKFNAYSNKISNFAKLPF
jgi:hypothetical protein